MEENEKMKDWLTELMSCTACHLRDEGNRGPTRYSGDCASPLMFVGEGPGGVEDEYGVPLVGPSGQLLDLRQTGHELVESKWQVYYDFKAAVEKAKAAMPDYTYQSPEKPDLLAQYAALKESRHW